MKPHEIAEEATALSQPQIKLLLALSGDEYRNWAAREMPGTIATRKKIEPYTERESARYPWMRKLTKTGQALQTHLLANRDTPNAE